MRDHPIKRSSPFCLAMAMVLVQGVVAQAAWAEPVVVAQDEPADESGDGSDGSDGSDDAAKTDEPIIIQPGSPTDEASPGDPDAENAAQAVVTDAQGAEPAVPDPYVRPADANRPGIEITAEEEPIQMPIIFSAPTGHLLPAGIVLTQGGIDTAGGVSSDIRVGLGDVAEFGIGTNALINVRNNGGEPEAVPAYPTALFKMGISEDLLFRFQPAISLGFRKSFEVDHDDRKTRVAQLYLVASKSLGPKFRLHAGGVFWDASVERDDGTEVLLHARGVSRQLRAFGGIEIEPLPRSQILIELSWVPEFALGGDSTADRISLRPTLSWGVRYELAEWAMIESGVRVPDIQDVNLIDAQIFGQLRFVTRRFRKFLEGLE